MILLIDNVELSITWKPNRHVPVIHLGFKGERAWSLDAPSN